MQIALEGLVIQLAKSLGVMETRTKRIGRRVVLVQDAKVELMGPPIPGSRTTASHSTTAMARKWTFAELCHRGPNQGATQSLDCRLGQQRGLRPLSVRSKSDRLVRCRDPGQIAPLEACLHGFQ